MISKQVREAIVRAFHDRKLSYEEIASLLGIRCMTRVFRGADREAHCPAHDGEGDCSGVGGARPRVA